jgi:hypothetical protein
LLYTELTAALTRRQVTHYITVAESGSLRLVQKVRVFFFRMFEEREINENKRLTGRKERQEEK